MDWECICVDDGSLDDSPRIVERFAAKDARFRLIRQKNAGPGGARNTGLKQARGEYFTFVDADDLIHPEMLKRLLDLAQLHSADLVVCDYFRFESGNDFQVMVENPELLTGETDVQRSPLLSEMVNWRKFRVHPVGKLYRRAEHDKLRFPNLHGSEDAYASFDVYARSKCAVFSQMRLYGYRIVDDGLTRSLSKYRNYITGDAQVAVHGETLCRNHGVRSDITAQLVKPYIMRMFAYLNEMSIHTQLAKKEKKSLMEIARKGFENIKKCVAGRYSIIPFVHCVPYTSVRIRSLWLLILWQWVRTCILKRSINLFQPRFGLRKFGSSDAPKLNVMDK